MVGDESKGGLRCARLTEDIVSAVKKKGANRGLSKKVFGKIFRDVTEIVQE
jgi:hypothetical protein